MDAPICVRTRTVLAMAPVVFDGVGMLWKESLAEGIIGLAVILTAVVKFSSKALSMMHQFMR